MSECPGCHNALNETGKCDNPNCSNNADLFFQETKIGPKEEVLLGVNAIETVVKRNLEPLNIITGEREYSDSSPFGLQTNFGSTPELPPYILPLIANIDGYKIIKLIGQGGMGIVLEAIQISLDRKVAIKVLPRHLAKNPDFVRRFHREATALAKLSHPNIVSIIDRGNKGDCYYFVMEFVEGNSKLNILDLRQALDKEKLDPGRVREIGIQSAGALGHAHSLGIYHRDIKPANILLDSNWNVKVSDFGIAALRTSQTIETRIGQAMGTLGYMAPEQIKDASSVDGRADIYSLGLVLYECLTGILPAGIFSPPSKTNTTIDKGWDDLLEAMLQPNRETRLAKMTDVVQRLKSISESGKVIPSANQEINRETTSGKKLPTIPLTCHYCATPIFGTVEFCTSCGKPTISRCPECAFEMPGGTPHCGKCGLGLKNLHQWNEVCKNIARLEKELGNYHGISPPFALFNELVIACQHAMSLMPIEASRLALEKNRKGALLAITKFAYDFWKAKNFQECVSSLDFIKKLDPNHFPIKHLEKQVSDELSKITTEVGAEIKKGNLTRAIQIVEDSQKAWGNVPDLEKMHQDLEILIANTKNLLDLELPKLKKEKKIHSILQELKSLKLSGITFPWVDKTINQAETLLKEADASFKQAERYWKIGKRDKAVLVIEKILDKVADHPDSLALREKILKRTDELSQYSINLNEALDKGNFFSAAEMILAMEAQSEKKDRFNKAQVVLGINRTINFFSPLIAWLLGVLIIGGIGLIVPKLSFNSTSIKTNENFLNYSLILVFAGAFVQMALFPWLRPRGKFSLDFTFIPSFFTVAVVLMVFENFPNWVGNDFLLTLLSKFVGVLLLVAAFAVYIINLAPKVGIMPNRESFRQSLKWALTAGILLGLFHWTTLEYQGEPKLAADNFEKNGGLMFPLLFLFLTRGLCGLMCVPIDKQTKILLIFGSFLFTFLYPGFYKPNEIPVFLKYAGFLLWFALGSVIFLISLWGKTRMWVMKISILVSFLSAFLAAFGTFFPGPGLLIVALTLVLGVLLEMGDIQREFGELKFSKQKEWIFPIQDNNHEEQKKPFKAPKIVMVIPILLFAITLLATMTMFANSKGILVQLGFALAGILSLGINFVAIVMLDAPRKSQLVTRWNRLLYCNLAVFICLGLIHYFP